MSSYEEQTRNAYRSAQRAAAYVQYQERRWSWGRLTTRLEQRAVARLLRGHVAPGDTVFDVPCGTGILGPTLAPLGARLVGGDISREMMALAGDAYRRGTPLGFLQADITRLPLPDASVDGVVTLGFMHRVPAAIRRSALAEIDRVSRRFALISFSLDSAAERAKHALVGIAMRRVRAPHPATRAEVEGEIAGAGFRIAARVAVLPLLSAESLFLVEKAGPRR